jgi:hypothetical protein
VAHVEAAGRRPPVLRVGYRDIVRGMGTPRRGIEVLRRRAGDLRHRHEIAEFRKANPSIGRVIKRVRDAGLTFLSEAALVGLAKAVTEVDRDAVEGSMLEAGTALGGSAVVLAAAKARPRPLSLFDTFGMIPPPSDKDGADVHERYEVIASGRSKGIDGSEYYGYRADLLGEVRQSLANFGFPAEENNVSLVRGLYEDTLHVDGPVALAHIDCDWYDSVTTCLQRIVPYLSPGGRLVIDDYETWSGAHDAVEDFFANLSGFEFQHRARLHIIRR